MRHVQRLPLIPFPFKSSSHLTDIPVPLVKMLLTNCEKKEDLAVELAVAFDGKLGLVSQVVRHAVFKFSSGKQSRKKICFFYNDYKRPLTPPALFLYKFGRVLVLFWVVFCGFQSSFGRFSGSPQNKSKVAQTFL